MRSVKVRSALGNHGVVVCHSLTVPAKEAGWTQQLKGATSTIQVEHLFQFSVRNWAPPIQTSAKKPLCQDLPLSPPQSFHSMRCKCQRIHIDATPTPGLPKGYGTAWLTPDDLVISREVISRSDWPPNISIALTLRPFFSVLLYIRTLLFPRVT